MVTDFTNFTLVRLLGGRSLLANRMPWQEIEASLAHCFARQAKASKKIEDLD